VRYLRLNKTSVCGTESAAGARVKWQHKLCMRPDSRATFAQRVQNCAHEHTQEQAHKCADKQAQKLAPKRVQEQKNMETATL
jgi:hypothetical protein